MDSSFKKRTGTSSISGQLYETKLISLILFRLLHNDCVEEFYMASNMDDIGNFDDICVKIKVSGHERPIYALLQAKHKEKEDIVLRYQLIQELSASFVKVRQKFLNKDSFFTDKFDDTNCLFILYTNAKYCDNLSYEELERANLSPSTVLKQAWIPYQSNFADTLNMLIATGDADSQGFQADYTDKDLEYANEKILEEEINILAEHFSKFLDAKTNQSMNIMHDYVILRYHVILADSVVDISEVKSEENKAEPFRELTFRRNFFDTNDGILKNFRNKLYEHILKTQIKIKKDNKVKEKVTSTIDELISSFLSAPSAVTLNPLIGTYIIYKNGSLEFGIQRPNSDIKVLEKINISSSIVDEAKTVAARNILSSLKIKVPVTFGNLDLKIPGNQVKVEKRLNTLTEFIVDLCKKSKFNNLFEIVTIDESVGEGLLSLNGGIGSAIGNLLVYDKVTKFLKFTENCESLQNNARNLLYKLNIKLNNLQSYRFDVTAIVTFPKLIFDFIDEAKTIFKLAVIYDKQRNHSGVETLLKKEIEQHHRTNEPHNLSIKSDSMVIHYHDEIQKWWMSPKSAKYLIKSKNNNIYQQAIDNIITEPQISAMQTTFNMNNMKYFRYSFSENALELNSRIIIATYIFTLTTLKVIQCLKNKYAVLDTECISNLSIKDFIALITELKDTDKTLIIICKFTKHSPILYKRLYELAQVTQKKKLIVITTNEFVETVEEYFLITQVISDKNQSLNELTLESRRDIMKSTQVIFQGETVSLDLLVDDESECIKMIKGAVLNNILHNETIVIGKSLSNSSYEKIQHLYVNRRVRKVTKIPTDMFSYVLQSFNDIYGNAVIILADAGMGKSTLLTHLSLNMKQNDGQIWIVRINLLDHTKMFEKWKNAKIIIDTLEAIKFMCKFVLDSKELSISLKEINSKMYLEACTSEMENNNNEWDSFVISIFLHFYNEKKLLFLFDGYDEICPDHTKYVIYFINAVKNFPREHKTWVTSRPYSDILPKLQEVIGVSYIIDYLNQIEQTTFLQKFWQEKLPPNHLNDNQITTLTHLLDYKKRLRFADIDYCKRLLSLFCNLADYVYLHFSMDSVNLATPEMQMTYYHSIREKPNDDEVIDYNNVDLFDSESTVVLTSDMVDVDKELMGTPLLLYLLANHIVNLIYTFDNENDEEEQKLNLFTMYDMFIETQLGQIRFEAKNEMDISKPDVKRTIIKERLEFIDMHKKLAAHVLLWNSFCLFDEFKNIRPFTSKNNSPEMNAMLNQIKSATEKTGLISHVTADNIPVFVHKTFAEYFASEFLCDIFISRKLKFSNKRLLYGVLTHRSRFIIDYWINKKIKIDRDLRKVIKEIKLDSIGFGDCKILSDLLNCSLFLSRYEIERLVKTNKKEVRLDYKKMLRLLCSSFNDYDYTFLTLVKRNLPEVRREEIRHAKNELFWAQLSEYNYKDTELNESLYNNLIDYIKDFINKYFVDEMMAPHLRRHFVDGASNIQKPILKLKNFRRILP